MLAASFAGQRGGLLHDLCIGVAGWEQRIEDARGLQYPARTAAAAPSGREQPWAGPHPMLQKPRHSLNRDAVNNLTTRGGAKTFVPSPLDVPTGWSQDHPTHQPARAQGIAARRRLANVTEQLPRGRARVPRSRKKAPANCPMPTIEMLRSHCMFYDRQAVGQNCLGLRYDGWPTGPSNAVPAI